MPGVVVTASAGAASAAGGGAGSAGAGVVGVVTLRCGRWRVTALPLASLAVRVGERVRAGATIGRVGTMPGHAGLHVGVRRASDRFAYVDPLPLLAEQRARRSSAARAAACGGRAAGEWRAARAPARRVAAAPAGAGPRRASRRRVRAARRAARAAPRLARRRAVEGGVRVPGGWARALARLGRARSAGARGGRGWCAGAGAAGSRAGPGGGTFAAMIAALLIGFGLGASVAAQLGPMSLLTIRSTLRNGVGVGLAIGAGIAVIDTLYAAAGAAGAGVVLSFEPIRVVAGVIGALVLVYLGAKTLWSAFRIRLGGETGEELATPKRAFVVALGATASNPLTIASWAAVFAAASTAGAAEGAATLTLLAGVGLGSMAWMTVLTGGVSLLRRWVGDRMLRTVDGLAGIGLLGFGGLLAYRTFKD